MMSPAEQFLFELIAGPSAAATVAFFRDSDGWIGALGREGIGHPTVYLRRPALKPHAEGPDWSDFPESAAWSFLETEHFSDSTVPQAAELLRERIWGRDSESWTDLCGLIRAGIRRNEFQKIVPCRWRCTVLAPNERNQLLCLVTRLIASEPITGAYKFLLRSRGSIFFGATPELLFRRSEGKITVPAIAGTGKTQDASLLERSEKDVKEHEFVVAGIRESLEEIGLHPIISAPRTVLKAGAICHLNTLLEMDDPGPDRLPSTFLRDTLHPTAAIGGYPRRAATDFLHEHENWDRGLFASPILVGTETEELCLIAIRSALLRGDKLWQFAGAGFISESDPEHEWRECENKMDSISRFLFKGKK